MELYKECLEKIYRYLTQFINNLTFKTMRVNFLYKGERMVGNLNASTGIISTASHGNITIEDVSELTYV